MIVNAVIIGGVGVSAGRSAIIGVRPYSRLNICRGSVPMGAAPDSRTPVLVGLGEFSERCGDAAYRALSPVDLAAGAVRAALEDAGVATRSLAAEVDTVVGIRQFDLGGGFTPPALGRSDNFPRSVADRIGAHPARAVLPVIGGQSPQQMLNEVAATIATGNSEVTLLFGAEATSTFRHFDTTTPRPDFSEDRGGPLEDRGFGLEGIPMELLLDNSLNDAPSQFALLENARRARLGLSRADYAHQMGELFAPFSRVAADNPHAAAPKEVSVDELITPTDRNRIISTPYTRLLISRNLVNQAAAVLVVSVATARRLRIDPRRWVFLHGHADFIDKPMFDRPDLSRSRVAEESVSHALSLAGIGADELSVLDLYSCFPFSVFAVIDHLCVAHDDPRGLTVTGGLPFFGGPGNDYALHAIVQTCRRLRTAPGSFGLVGAAGGPFHKYSAGVYSTTPAPWRPGDARAVQHRLDSALAVTAVRHGQGWLTVETYTVKYTREGVIGVVVGLLEATGERIVATTTEAEALALLVEGEPLGQRVYVRKTESGNRMTLGPETVAARN